MLFRSTFFDDDRAQYVTALALLHLLLVIQEALLALLNALFRKNASLPKPLAKYLLTYGPKMADFAREKDEFRIILSELGAWSADKK